MVDVLGEVEAAIFGTRVEWSLTRIDDPEGDVIKGQFRPEDLTENASVSYATSNVPMSTAPYIQWTGGNLRTFKFRAQFWNKRTLGGAMDALGIDVPDNPIITGPYDVEKELKRLRQAMQPDKNLRRPPRWRFEYGNISADVVINSLGGIRYSEVWPDGRIKGANLEVELIEVPTPTLPKTTDLSIPPHMSRHRPVVQGDTSESLARTEYGSPLYGILLRQENTKAFPTAGDTVRLPERSFFRGATLEPASYALSSTDAAEAARRDLLESRGATKEMPFVLQ